MADQKDSKEKAPRKATTRPPRKGDILEEHPVFKGFFAPPGSEVYFRIRIPGEPQEQKTETKPQLGTSDKPAASSQTA